MSRPRRRGPRRVAVLLPGLACAALAGAGAGHARADSRSDTAALIRAWSAIPPEELQAAWADAQNTGGVIAIEPEAHAIGAQAGQKKTWDLADKALKLVWGNAPNWFPADLVRRTTCGSDARWSYFWHALSGDERDLHPWIGSAAGFGHLVGPAHATAIVASKALDLAPCSEVRGAAGPCLYGEVTAPEPFENWFCGRPKAECRARMTADPRRVPAEFGHPTELCFAGPWVMERVHAWRPEIHPAELLWARPATDRQSWRFALIPDGSGRFDEAKHFGALGRSSPQPWSRARPVEMWIAFASEPSRPIVLDLSRRTLRKKAEGTRTAALVLPAVADGFAALTHGLGDDLLAAVRSWRDPACDCTRGFLVLRARYPKKEREALLLGVTGRRPDEAATPALFGGAAAALEPSALELAPVVVPEVRLLTFTRVERSLGGAFVVYLMARFDPQHAAEWEDEDLAEKSNKALAGKDKAREDYFGTRRPFQVHWTLKAFRESSGASVPIVVPGRGRVAEGTDAAQVTVIPFKGKATAEMTINTRGPEPIEKAAADVVSLGELMVTIPAGVVVKGTGQVEYIGPTPLELSEPPLAAFRVPRQQYASEWDLLRQLLTEIDRDRAPDRVQALAADACHPLAAGCTLEAFSDEAARRIAEPAGRWDALRDLQEPNRSMARFLRLFSRALIWNKWTDDDERESLKRLLAAVYSAGGPPP